jgi:AraC-like DNA-binding protein
MKPLSPLLKHYLDEYEVKQRLRQKIRQTKEGKSNLPAIAIVVGFKVKLISLQPVEL